MTVFIKRKYFKMISNFFQLLLFFKHIFTLKLILKHTHIHVCSYPHRAQWDFLSVKGMQLHEKVISIYSPAFQHLHPLRDAVRVPNHMHKCEAFLIRSFQRLLVEGKSCMSYLLIDNCRLVYSRLQFGGASLSFDIYGHVNN